jgi:hypothetical protein
VPGLLLGTLWLLSGLIRLRELKRQRRRAFAKLPHDGGRGSYTKLAEQEVSSLCKGPCRDRCPASVTCKSSFSGRAGGCKRVETRAVDAPLRPAPWGWGAFVAGPLLCPPTYQPRTPTPLCRWAVRRSQASQSFCRCAAAAATAWPTGSPCLACTMVSAPPRLLKYRITQFSFAQQYLAVAIVPAWFGGARNVGPSTCSPCWRPVLVPRQRMDLLAAGSSGCTGGTCSSRQGTPRAQERVPKHSHCRLPALHSLDLLTKSVQIARWGSFFCWRTSSPFTALNYLSNTALVCRWPP